MIKRTLVIEFSSCVGEANWEDMRREIYNDIAEACSFYASTAEDNSYNIEMLEAKKVK